MSQSATLVLSPSPYMDPQELWCSHVCPSHAKQPNPTGEREAEAKGHAGMQGYGAGGRGRERELRTQYHSTSRAPQTLLYFFLFHFPYASWREFCNLVYLSFSSSLRYLILSHLLPLCDAHHLEITDFFPTASFS